jgi:hypothetical protein
MLGWGASHIFPKIVQGEDRPVETAIIGTDETRYIQLEPNGYWVICSQIFPGLCLDKTALLSRDLAKVLAILYQ